jgi:hypothetical protein
MSRERTEKPVSPSTPTHVKKRKVNLGFIDVFALRQ